jgi:hypothetical protein
MCVSCSAALPFVVFSLVIVDHVIEIGRCRCSGHLGDRPTGVVGQRRFAVKTLEDIHGTPSRKSRGLESRGSLYAMC